MNNSPTPDESQNLAKQIIQLEEKLAFQQHAHEQLNEVVLEQQAEQQELRKELRSIRQTLQGILERGTGEDLPHEKPPHY